ncbi:MAG: hypothetical protein R3C68_08620 [Myxococcota bacterium]
MGKPGQSAWKQGLSSKKQWGEQRHFFTHLLLATTLLAPSLAWATDYFVSTSGNDAQAGSKSAPWRTLKFSLSQLVAGDTLFIRGGEYKETLMTHTGTDFPHGTSWENPVTVAAYQGERVTLQGRIAINKETPLTQYLIFDGITIDALGHEGGIHIQGGAHHIRFIRGEVKNAHGTSGISTGYGNDPNPGALTFNEFIDMDVHHNGLDESYYTEVHQAAHRHGFYPRKTALNINSTMLNSALISPRNSPIPKNLGSKSCVGAKPKNPGQSPPPRAPASR